MTYQPKAGDTIHSEGHEPITIVKITDATAKFKRGEHTLLEPRELFDSLLERTFTGGDTVVLRDGVQVFPVIDRGFLKDLGQSNDPGFLMPTEEGNDPHFLVVVDPAHPGADKTVTPGSSGSHNAHARLSPSSSKTWTNCTLAPAYVEANRHRIPKDSGSIYSDEGTQAHDHAADILLKKKTLADIPEDFRDPVGTYVDHCLALVPDGVSYQVEVQCPLFYQRDEHGTCDFCIVTDDRVTVRDYKHGAGVLVTSEGNTQLAIYAYSLIKHLEDIYDFTDDTVIDIKVVQPRHREADADEPWVLPLSEFRAFCAGIEEKAKIATQAVIDIRGGGLIDGVDASPSIVEDVCTEEARFTPQEGDEGSCRWCKARAFCGVRHAHTTGDAITSATLALMPDLTKEQRSEEPATVIDAQVVTDVPAHLEHGGTLPLEYLVSVFRNRKKIEKFLGDVEEYLENLSRENPIPGLKWVKGRDGNRSWRNEEEADTFLKGKKLKQDERYNYKLKSPTQIEALLKEELKNQRTKNRFEELISRSDGRPVLVPEEDKRTALPAPGDVMPNLEEEI